ncbi:hypothetical protein [Maribacter antarcticus]|uniref:hypothetical protein n=1 Tax=Maribacter antarcticus TaxID=505250 RepID=UPI00047E2676|nr:hypothetical protein [Maribacter antarcticus]
MTKNKQIKSKEAQEALDSIKEMEHVGLKRVLPTPKLLGAILALLIGTQIALLGAEIRTYNTILIVLIISIAIINKNQSAGEAERILLSKQTIIIGLICIIPLYFLAIISGQYLINHYEHYWAPFVIGAFVTISIWILVVSAQRSYINRFNEEKN